MLVILKPDKSIEVLDTWPDTTALVQHIWPLGTLIYEPDDRTPWVAITSNGVKEVPYRMLPKEAKTIQLLYPPDPYPSGPLPF